MATKIEIKQQDDRSSTQVLTVVFLCSIVIFILMTVCLMSSYWITAEGFRQGLLYLCIEERHTTFKYSTDAASSQDLPLPFDLSKEDLEPGCYPNRDVAYLKICTILCLITQLSAVASAFLTGLGVRLKGSNRITCLRFAICTTMVTLLCDICLVITYPVQFSKELDRSKRDVWELNGAFGLACGAAILALGALVLLIATFSRNLSIYESAPTRI